MDICSTPKQRRGAATLWRAILFAAILGIVILAGLVARGAGAEAQAVRTGAAVLPSEPALSASASRMYVSPATSTVKAGESFTVTVVISSTEMMRGAEAGLIFSPTLLEATGWEEGSLFKDWATANGGSTQVAPQPVIDNVHGTISLAPVYIVGGPGTQGPTGAGSLLIYHLRARSGVSGQSALTLPSNVSITDVNGDPLPGLVITGGQVQVGSGTPYLTSSRMYVSPVTSTVKAGESFTVTVIISSTEMMRGAEAGLIFSPTLLEATGWETGTLFSDWAQAHGASVQIGLQPVIDNVYGTISLAPVYIVGGPGTQGPTGAGSLLIYHLRAKPGAGGPSALTLDSRGAISDINGDLLPGLVVTGGQVTATPQFKVYLPLVMRSFGP